MQITLWQLNESYQALVRLAQGEFPKSQHKLAYRLSKVMKAAKSELEAATESMNDLMRKCGFEPGAQDVAPAKLLDYQIQFKDFMTGTTCDLPGDPIQLDDLGDLSVTAFDLALLDWLIQD